MRTGYKVGEVMTRRPICIGKTESIQAVSEQMERHNVGAVLVTEGNSIEGIITEEDIVRKAVAQAHDPFELTVKNLMTPAISTITANHDMHEAVLSMGRHNIRHLPVVEEDELVGLLTIKDVLRLEPQMFELVAHQLQLREEERKPIPQASEGLCNLCGHYSQQLVRNDEEALVCNACLTMDEPWSEGAQESDEET